MEHKRISQKEIIAAGQNIKEKKFWLNQFSGKQVKSNFYYDNKAAGNNGEFDTENIRLTGELYLKLEQLSGKSLLRLHMILSAALILLIERYTGNTDIIIGVPVYKQETEIDFVNTVLPIGNSLKKGNTFKDLLLQVRQTIADAVEHANYPINVLAQEIYGNMKKEEDF
ncbi:MAG: hypothetical protein GY757_47275, partial [bacterium]|nr:hypothetical protein [bacterium]